MIRLLSIATISVSLLLCVQVFGNSPDVEHPEIDDQSSVYCPSTPRPCPTTQKKQPTQQQYWSCPIPGHTHPIGTPCPVPAVGHFFGDTPTGQRFGLGSAGATMRGFKLFNRSNDAASASPGQSGGTGLASGLAPRIAFAQRAEPARPAGPPPKGLLEGVFATQQYQKTVPMTGQQHSNIADHLGHPDFQHGQGHLITHPGHVPERIVYVPYAMPPPIHVERLGKALARPFPWRKMLGDANMHEYPEMPLNMYTTRGPRDFLAPNPPSIGY
ncbi:MAG: hypothetical protein FWG73_00095 [Planctomycetaceae bacterium]|nr:hypothetical protein [Planctomycetaceae bacterium]